MTRMCSNQHEYLTRICLHERAPTYSYINKGDIKGKRRPDNKDVELLLGCSLVNEEPSSIGWPDIICTTVELSSGRRRKVVLRV